MTKLISVDDVAGKVPDGATVAIAKPPQEPVALGRALIARGVRDLTLITVPTGAYLADLLIGAGALSAVETSGLSLGEHGKAPAFDRAVRAGSITIRDATCPAIYAALQAGEKGLPFLPIRGLIGSDLLAARPDWPVFDNPLAPGDLLVAIPALRPDVALIHVPLADRHGNLWIGGRHELRTLGHAAHSVLATAERVVDGNLMQDPLRAPATLPGHYVTALAEAPRGAWPSACPGADGGPGYPADAEHLAAYARLARDPDRLADYIRDTGQGPLAAE